MTQQRRRYGGADERDLIAWAQEGDERAFGQLVNRYRTMLQTICYRITGDEQLAQDAAQAALLAAWKHIGRFEHRSKFSTWLYRIAHNAALATIRKRRPEPVGELAEQAAGTARGADETVGDVQSVRWALSKLPEDFRAALVLREYGGLSYQEIAEAQGIKVETVKTRISRARQGLAVLLADRD
ncbi:MAG: sigma-70 family RNA polymerase sigma factor [Acidimicrobiales bacterium]|jgi:RNA polymerase sigma-70 factor (ECF subfamily)|nr:sigma-70 family RNA polymerase sigma factor [Acidimicrobiales bacterium]